MSSPTRLRADISDLEAALDAARAALAAGEMGEAERAAKALSAVTRAAEALADLGRALASPVSDETRAADDAQARADVERRIRNLVRRARRAGYRAGAGRAGDPR
ncbi:MAG: hypothetical protein KJS97_08630 [Alphaproteobacteria bacterium]|nr:hypothetical protein [Alphaproteobacteria bacterium]